MTAHRPPRSAAFEPALLGLLLLVSLGVTIGSAAPAAAAARDVDGRTPLQLAIAWGNCLIHRPAEAGAALGWVESSLRSRHAGAKDST